MAARRRTLPHWSSLALLLRVKRMRGGQVGDGRETAMAEHVLGRVPPGDLDGAIRAVDEFASGANFMVNVGDEKGAVLEAAVRRARPRRALELGTYCGYSAMRIARAMPPGARLWSVERHPANAEIAERIWAHVGIADRVTCVRGHLGDGGTTLGLLRERHGLDQGVDFVFIDHAKSQYLADLRRILAEGWLHPGSVVLADNVRVPGAPEYRAYLRRREGLEWRTTEHRAHLEYQRVLPDLMLESMYRGSAGQER